MGFFDVEPLTQVAPGSLQPLVKKGENREQVLREIVRLWCKPLGKVDPESHFSAGGFVLENKEFVDENTGTPIDLGGLLRQVSQQVTGNIVVLVNQPFILIRRCLITSCQVIEEVELPMQFAACAVAFGGPAEFGRVLFLRNVSFRKSRFFYSCGFTGTSFLGQSDFQDAGFILGSNFCKTLFDETANFRGAQFHGTSLFNEAEFSKNAEFTDARWHLKAGFSDAKIRGRADFNAAKFHDLAQFVGTQFGHAAFGRTAFEGNVSFSHSEFGMYSHFDGATFKHAPTFVNAKFAFEGGITGARVGKTLPREWWPRLLARIIKWWNWSDWSRVGAMGRVHAFTRVSYLALFVVPIIAGIWPAVRNSVLAVAHDAHRATVAARAAVVEVQELIPASFSAPEVVGRIRITTDELEALVANAEKTLAEFRKKPLCLPFGLGLAFFGALSVALGHFVYQIWCPELIRAASRAAHRKSSTASFREAPANQRKDLLLLYFELLRQVAQVRPYSRCRTLVCRHDRTVWIPESLGEFRLIKREPEGKGDAVRDDFVMADPGAAIAPHTCDELELIVADEGANAEYILASRQNRWSMRLSGLLYSVGLFLVAWLVYLQAVNVWQAAWPTATPAG